VRIVEEDTMEEESKKELKLLADFIYAWCSKIDRDGGGWDEWDDFYKDAYHNKDTEIYKIIRKHMTARPQV
jgi:hypothetical protein